MEQLKLIARNKTFILLHSNPSNADSIKLIYSLKENDFFYSAYHS